MWECGNVENLEICTRLPDYIPTFPHFHISKSLTSPNKIDDLDVVALVDLGRGVRVALDDEEIALDGHAARVEAEARQELRDGLAARQRVWLAVERDGHRPPSPRRRRPRASRPKGVSSARSFRSPGLRMCAGSVMSGSGRPAASRKTRS